MSNSARILLRKSVTSFKENIPHFLLNFSPSSQGWFSVQAAVGWHRCWENTQQQWSLQSGRFLFGFPLMHYVSWDDGNSVINSVRCNCYNHFAVTHNKGNMVST